ncbi:peptidoglycan DD-metalloendopeptidase family protein [candidate division KSB1 bacterium]|nr:peptidoglycan DD-metalloendopeptidase family protein [candidate division KSB1 bacterium]
MDERKRKYLAILLLLFIGGCVRQAYAEAEERQRELQSLQEEIKKYEQQLVQAKEKEKSTANLIASLDRQIDVTSGMLSSLRNEISQKDGQIKARSEQVTELQDQVARLRQVIKKRLVSFYKYGRRRDYELLLAGGSWHKANVWLKYQKMVAHNDRRNIESLLTKVQALQEEQQQLQLDVAHKANALAQNERRSEQLVMSRQKRQTHLATVRKDAEYLKQHMRELESAQEQIRGYIARSEKKRTDKQRQISHKKEIVMQKPTRDYNFSALRGHLPWPTRGDVISHFGKQRHPTLKTVTENLGIEISAPLGAPVQAVDGGQVQTITWQRGRGNIIIVSHDDGYYTVYTHLSDIRVNLMDYVEPGQIIGAVGDSGSLNGPVLHFQIWKNTDNLNPEEWLG